MNADSTNPNAQAAETIFNAALAFNAAERPAYLAGACGDNLVLRQRVEVLLRAHEASPAFLPEQPAATARPTIKLELSDAPVAEGPGTKIGRYKLLQKIGEGGMGLVYMAEQEEPVRRRVALKIIKLGMDTKQVVARFEAERQALAMMDHPNIARVLDGGATEAGRPYFVMELVHGVPITEFCDQNKLPARERLKLFVQVCQAIQSAHQKAIIHRDIKPSNVLVTLHHGDPMPKVIDFGIAKATSQKLTEKTLFTNFGTMIGTPAYMSPEQAEMSSLDVDTRADVYSLGVLLYEMLTGGPPFPEKRLRSLGYGEMQRVIMEEEPERPSTRLSTMDQEQRTTVARNHGEALESLSNMLKGDLDWIVMKCLEKDRSRRYETANGLALDLKRHLDNEPVVARPPSTAYRLQKAWRRHQTALSVAFLIAGVLIAATAFSGWQAIRATRAMTQAKQRLAESEAISKFLSGLFENLQPGSEGRASSIPDVLAAAAKKLETDLTNQPARRIELQATLGETYAALGLFREAVPLQEKVRDYYFANSGPEDDDTLAAMLALASSYDEVNRQEEALKLREQALAIYRKKNGPEDEWTLNAMLDVATSYDSLNRSAEALKLREDALAVYRKVSGPESPGSLAAMSGLAISYGQAGRPGDALKLGEQTLALYRKVNGPEHPNTLVAMDCLAGYYQQAGRLQDAIKLAEQTLDLRRKVSGETHPATLTAMQDLADYYDDSGRVEQALPLREQLLKLRQQENGPDSPEAMATMSSLAQSYAKTGRCRELLDLLETICKLNSTDTGTSVGLAVLQAWFGRDADYEATRTRLVHQANGQSQASTLTQIVLAASLRPSTNAELRGKVLNLARRALEAGKNDSDAPWYQLGFGLAEYREGRYAAAEQTLAAALQTGSKFGEFKGIAGLIRSMSLFRLGRPEEARKLFNQIVAQMPTPPNDDGRDRVSFKEVTSQGISVNVLVLWLACEETKSVLNESSL